ncbi:MAG: TolB family protein [Acidimicrobiales bacterium]
MKRLLELMLVACLVTSCGSPTDELALATPLGIPFERDIDGFAWLDDGAVIVSTYPDRLALWRPGGEIRELRPVTPTELGCRVVGYGGPVKLSSGAVGVVRDCSRDGSAVSPRYLLHLVELDIESGSTREIVEAKPLVREVRYGQPQKDYQTNEIPWRADHQSAFIEIGDAICPTFAELKPDGVHFLDVVIRDGDDQWNMGTDPDPATCEQGGRALGPTVSPAGERLAFFASVASGAGGPDRIGTPGSLYVTNLQFGDPTPVVGGVTYLQSLVWLDEHRLAVSAETVDGAEGPGLWLIDTRTGKSNKIFDNTLDSLAISPDGDEIAGVDRKKGKQDQLIKVAIPK